MQNCLGRCKNCWNIIMMRGSFIQDVSISLYRTLKETFNYFLLTYGTTVYVFRPTLTSDVLCCHFCALFLYVCSCDTKPSVTTLCQPLDEDLCVLSDRNRSSACSWFMTLSFLPAKQYTLLESLLYCQIFCTFYSFTHFQLLLKFKH